MTRLPLTLLLLSCATPPEVVREPLPCSKVVQDAGAESGGSEMSTPSFGSVLVVLRTADGEEYTVICGGEVSLVSGTGRTLLKLDRSGAP